MDDFNRLKGMLYGHAIGDALGVPVEFCKRDSYHLEGMIGYGTYSQPEGTWSDDTSLTLCLVENLVKGSSLDDLMDMFVRYYRDGYMTPFNECFDIGTTTRLAVENRYYLNKRAEECGLKGNSSNGNGSLMRIAPLIMKTYKLNDINDKLEVVKNYSRITHAHSISELGCLIYILCLEEVLSGTLKEDILSKVYLQLLGLLKENREYLYILDDYYIHLFDDNIRGYSRDAVQSSGYIVHTLEASLWCFLNADTFDEGVLLAVNLGGDTDTIGAVTGSLLGVYYGYGSIRQQWLTQLQSKSLLDKYFNQYLNKIDWMKN